MEGEVNKIFYYKNNKMKKYISHSEKKTRTLAKEIAAGLTTGTVLGLSGELGSGKTQFTKGLAEYFDIKNTITSPTFVLLKPYNIKNKKHIKQLIHVDCYRLDNPGELLAIGLQEFMADKNNLIVIEWAEKIKDILPKNTQWIKFKTGKKENEREVSLLAN